MDNDGNGNIDLKEYRISRFLFDGTASKILTKDQFKTMANNEHNKLYKKVFKENFFL